MEFHLPIPKPHEASTSGRAALTSGLGSPATPAPTMIPGESANKIPTGSRRVARSHAQPVAISMPPIADCESTAPMHESGGATL